MAYSHSRLRRTLASVRILTGMLFLVLGAHKISSWEFAKVEFPQFLYDATHGAAAGFYADFLNSFVGQSTSGLAAMVAGVELFIGIGLVLGLAVRPITAVGMVYVVNLALATWNVPGPNEPLWRSLDQHGKLILLFCVFLLLGVGHAGENWGLGSLYHHQRHRLWEKKTEEPPETDARRHQDEPDTFQQDWKFGGASSAQRIKM